jgi:hypothetical protein
MAETNKKADSDLRLALMLVAVLACIGIYQKGALLESLAVQSSDGLIFVAWIGILALIYVRLKSVHKEMARERKQLVRLKALEHRLQSWRRR